MNGDTGWSWVTLSYRLIVSRKDRADPERLDQLELTILEEG